MHATSQLASAYQPKADVLLLSRTYLTFESEQTTASLAVRSCGPSRRCRFRAKRGFGEDRPRLQAPQRCPGHNGCLATQVCTPRREAVKSSHVSSLTMRKPACRFPFLLVDRVIELEPEKYAVGYKNVTINDNFFPGHFPQRAIMPGKHCSSPTVTVLFHCQMFAMIVIMHCTFSFMV